MPCHLPTRGKRRSSKLPPQWYTLGFFSISYSFRPLFPYQPVSRRSIGPFLFRRGLTIVLRLFTILMRFLRGNFQVLPVFGFCVRLRRRVVGCTIFGTYHYFNNVFRLRYTYDTIRISLMAFFRFSSPLFCVWVAVWSLVVLCFFFCVLSELFSSGFVLPFSRMYCGMEGVVSGRMCRVAGGGYKLPRRRKGSRRHVVDHLPSRRAVSSMSVLLGRLDSPAQLGVF